MGFVYKSLVVFDGLTSTGIDKIPHNSYVQISDDGNGDEMLLFVLDVSTYTTTSTVSNLLSNTSHYHKLLVGSTTFGSSVGDILDIDSTPELSADLECNSFDINDVDFRHRYHKGIDLNTLTEPDGSDLIGILIGSNYFYYNVTGNITIGLPDAGAESEGKKIILKLSSIGTAEINFQANIVFQNNLPPRVTEDYMFIEFLLLDGTWYGNKIIPEASSAWDLSTLTLLNTPDPIVGTVKKSAGIYFRPDGRMLYIMDTYDDAHNTFVHQYIVSTPWDSSKATYFGEYQMLNDLYMESMHISPDGSSVFTIGSGADKFYQYNLSTPWDITTASLYTSKYTISGSIRAMTMSADGTQIYCVNGSTNITYQWQLSVPFDLATMSGSYTQKAISTGGTLQAMHLSPDGTKMFYGDISSPYNIYQWNLNTPWNITTAVDSGISISAGVGVQGLFIDGSGTHLYTGTDGPTIRQYIMG